MPIDAYLPTIDDRRFEDIVAEARTRIPRYTPEWTDLNDNDPGIALVQVFAWMCDLLLYRLGKVPELNYLKFLQLVGIEVTVAAIGQGGRHTIIEGQQGRIGAIHGPRPIPSARHGTHAL